MKNILLSFMLTALTCYGQITGIANVQTCSQCSGMVLIRLYKVDGTVTYYIGVPYTVPPNINWVDIPLSNWNKLSNSQWNGMSDSQWRNLGN